MLFLLANWQRILMAIGILGFVGYIGFQHWHLAYDEAWIRHYDAVQKRNGEAIAAQNRAVRKMWLENKVIKERSEKAKIVVNKIMTKTLVSLKKPIRFTQSGTCDQDVEETLVKVRGLK
ncbi:MAG: hypothetical protein ACYCR5_04420 [Leptospirillum sp.]